MYIHYSWHGGEEINAAVCKTAMRGFESLPCLFPLGRVAELVYAADLKSAAQKACGFKSHLAHQNKIPGLMAWGFYFSQSRDKNLGVKVLFRFYS